MYQGALQFMWNSLKNFYINKTRVKTIKIDSNVNNDCIDIIDKEYNYNVHNEILEAIDRKLIKERIINTRKGIFLLTLKDYLINNEYDERGFCEYCCEVMSINKYNYSQIAYKVNIRTGLLNKKNNNI